MYFREQKFAAYQQIMAGDYFVNLFKNFAKEEGGRTNKFRTCNEGKTQFARLQFSTAKE